MKNLATYLLATCFCLLSLNLLAVSQDGDHKKETIVENSGNMELNARVFEGNVYFNVKFTNEKHDGFYSLVRIDENEEVSSIGVKEATPNNLNLPLLYSFSDQDVPSENVSYQLILITIEGSELIGAWNYNHSENSIELMPDDEVAENN